MLTVSQLDSWLGKTISEICLNGYTNNADNHCAHFVSHAVNLSFGYTCASHTRKGFAGANLRVHEVFERCGTVYEIQQCTPEMSGLVFISAPSNFVTQGGRTELRNVPRKHIGLLFGGNVWHYSNTRDLVVKQPMSMMLYHYAGQTNALWYGSLPADARPIWFGQC